MPVPLLPIILLLLPLAEIATFVMVGSEIGALATIGLVLATSIAGAVLLRIQGLGVLARMRAQMERGEPPGRELAHALMIAGAAVLLILPGFITDTIGLLLFIPPIRDAAWRLMRGGILSTVQVRTFRSRQQPGGAERTIDLDADDFTRTDDPKRNLPPH